ncbi:hypothetical protein BLX88_00270 [Bacillus obstructivus]|nr:hypothetical protein BLX88_00270 [Bacillus obstructivus]
MNRAAKASGRLSRSQGANFFPFTSPKKKKKKKKNFIYPPKFPPQKQEIKLNVFEERLFQKKKK